MGDKEFFEQLKLQLTEQQRAAVTHVDGPVLVLAVPGSGKTTMLVCRIGYMILCRNIEPESILALSYTKASAGDMGRRFRSFFGDELADRVRFRTINSLCVSVMREYERRSGKKSFRLAAESDTGRILAEGWRRHEEGYPTDNDIAELKRQIAYIKNMGLGAEEIGGLESDYQLADLYADYEKSMRASGLMDYDDQLRSAKVLLQKIPAISAGFRKRYPYLLVDEAQDSSKIQHELFRLLSAGSLNICEVGDEDQSIYGFRAAFPEALLSFERDFPGAEVLYMEDTFRSCTEIVRRADRFISRNTERREKHMRAARKERGTVRNIVLKNRQAQYSWLLKAAENCTVQTAVLYRNNESALPLIDLLERSQIPYSLKTGEMNFFSNRVVQDAENIMRFALDPTDTELFLQIYYKISTYLTKENARHMAELAEKSRGPVLAEAFRLGNVSPRVLAPVRRAAELLSQAARSTPREALKLIMGELGFSSYLERSGLDSTKLFLLIQLSYRENTLRDFLERLKTLSALVAEKENDPKCLFLLSTIHGSKGLEYDRVCLMDMLNGILPEDGRTKPEDMSPEERKAYEEARRLFYVAVTRAKNELMVFTFEDGTSCFSAELLKPLPAPGARKQAVPKGAGAEQRNLSDGGYERFLTSLHIGQRVVHTQFGSCEIEAISRNIISLKTGTEVKRFSLQYLYLHDCLII